MFITLLLSGFYLLFSLSRFHSLRGSHVDLLKIIFEKSLGQLRLFHTFLTEFSVLIRKKCKEWRAQSARFV